MTVARTRILHYSLARFSGEYKAVKRGRIGQRITNRVIGRRRHDAL